MEIGFEGKREEKEKYAPRLFRHLAHGNWNDLIRRETAKRYPPRAYAIKDHTIRTERARTVDSFDRESELDCTAGIDWI